MTFYLDKTDGTTQKLTNEEVRKYLSKYQIELAIEAKRADPLEQVSYIVVGGFIRVEFE